MKETVVAVLDTLLKETSSTLNVVELLGPPSATYWNPIYTLPLNEERSTIPEETKT